MPLMKYFNIIICILLLIGCRKKENKFEVYREPQSVYIDSEKLNFKSLLVRDFYKKNEYNTVWFDEKNRNELIDVLISSEKHALNPDHFKINKLNFYNQYYSMLPYEQLIEADVLYSDTFIQYIKQLAHGRINPKKYYGDWEPYLRELDFNQLLIDAVSKNELEKVVERITPKNTFYTGLNRSYLEYYSLGKDTLTDLRAKDISKIKRKLFAYGDYTSEDFSMEWNNSLAEALKNFQRRFQITPSGTPDERTLEQLNVSWNERLKKIIVNMERARWLPDDLGAHYVWVNLPEFMLYVYENKQLVETHRVIIGKESRKTPVLSSKFSNLIINPTWTVPPTILKKDLVPNATHDREYFASQRMTIYNKNNQVVDPEDWNPENAKSYRYVQSTGNANALGLIKFDFPNKHMVYLHDTNNKSKFSAGDRALSSGCVRVQNPFDLAERILKMERNNSYDREKLDTLVARKKTVHIRLKKEVNVHQLYFTAWTNDQGVQFRDDVYQLDAGLYRKIMN